MVAHPLRRRGGAGRRRPDCAGSDRAAQRHQRTATAGELMARLGPPPAAAATATWLRPCQDLELNRRARPTVAAMDATLERLKESRRVDHEREVARRQGPPLDEMAINEFQHEPRTHRAGRRASGSDNDGAYRRAGPGRPGADSETPAFSSVLDHHVDPLRKASTRPPAIPAVAAHGTSRPRPPLAPLLERRHDDRWSGHERDHADRAVRCTRGAAADAGRHDRHR